MNTVAKFALLLIIVVLVSALGSPALTFRHRPVL